MYTTNTVHSRTSYHKFACTHNYDKRARFVARNLIIVPAVRLVCVCVQQPSIHQSRLARHALTQHIVAHYASHTPANTQPSVCGQIYVAEFRQQPPPRTTVTSATAAAAVAAVDDTHSAPSEIRRVLLSLYTAPIITTAVPRACSGVELHAERAFERTHHQHHCHGHLGYTHARTRGVCAARTGCMCRA